MIVACSQREEFPGVRVVAARRAVRDASENSERQTARAAVNTAKRASGERPVWRTTGHRTITGTW